MDDVQEVNGDLENACRLCLTTKLTRSSIFDVPESSIPFSEKIRVCLSIQVSTNDKFPTVVCETCVKNINQWHSYKDVCLQSQEKLQKWFERKNTNAQPMVSIKIEPFDQGCIDDNVEDVLEKTNETNAAVPNINSMDVDPETENIQPSGESNEIQSKTKDVPLPTLEKPSTIERMKEHSSTIERTEEHSAITERIEEDPTTVQIKSEPIDTEDEFDENVEYESDISETRPELLLNPLAKQSINTERIIEADSTQKSITTKATARRRIRRRTRTHFRGTRLIKMKCVHCNIHLHSKFSYQQHMSRYHGIIDKSSAIVIKQKSKLMEHRDNIEPTLDSFNEINVEEKEYIKMIKTDCLTPVQKNIISQLKTFSCYTCKQSFFDRRHTLNHIRQHMPDLRPFTCIACLTEFSDRSMYKLHCNASFECAMKIALVVPTIGNEKYFTCNMCLRSFNNRKELLEHLAIHSSKQTQQLGQHLRSPHKLKSAVSSTPKADSPLSKKSICTLSGPYMNGDPAHNHKCDLCGMIYRYKPNMFKHRELCATLPESIRTSYRCVHCSMTYLVFKKFYTHIFYDHKRREITCFTCHTQFTTPDDYLTHHESHRIIKNKTNEETSNEEQQLDSTCSKAVNSSDLNDKPFVCALCNESFNTQAELTEHRNLHLKVKIYSCVICRNMFSSANTLAQHMKEHGIEESGEQAANQSNLDYEGNSSQNSFNNSSLSASSDPGGKDHRCFECGRNFSNYANLKRHERNLHIQQKRRRWSCHICKRRFRSAAAFEEHLKLDHGSEQFYTMENAMLAPPPPPPPPPPPQSTMMVSPVTGKPLLQCPKCPRTFAYQGNLIIHCQNVHKENHFERAMANSISAPTPPPPPPPPIVSPPARFSKNHYCDICGKTFREEQSLKAHRGWHLRTNNRLKSDLNMSAEENPLSNPEYPTTPVSPVTPVTPVVTSPKPAKARKSFPNNPSQRQLDNLASVQCQVCDDRFSDVAELRKHLWDVHCSRNKPEKAFAQEFQCELCPTKFSDETSLENHMKWHSQNPVSSNDRDNEDSIVAESSLIDASKPFYCDICGKYYSNRKVYLRHKKLHKVLPPSAIMNFHSLHSRRNFCQPCQKNFSTEGSLRRHKTSPCHIMMARSHQMSTGSARKITTTALVHHPPPEAMDHIPIIKKEPGTVDSTVPSQYQPQPLQHKRRPVTCHVCKMVFPNMSVLYKHKQLVHSKMALDNKLTKPASQTTECVPLVSPEGLICCNVCGKQFPGISNLKQHFSHKHKNKNIRYTCYSPGCKLVFNNANALRIHESSHSNIIFNCHLCDRHVFSRGAIIKHMHNMHKAIYQSGVEKNSLWTETDLTTYTVKNCQSTACPKCKIKYPNLRALKIHYLKFHEKA